MMSSEIDASLIFDESGPELAVTHLPLNVTFSQLILDETPTFSEWLEQATMLEKTDEELAQSISPSATSASLPAAFDWAEQAADQTNDMLATISFEGLQSIGQALGSLMSIVGACGPLCMHGLSTVANLSSGALPLKQLGLSQASFNSSASPATGHLQTLAHATGLTKEALRSGKYSLQDLLVLLCSVWGENLCCLFGFGLIESLIDQLIPLPSSRAA